MEDQCNIAERTVQFGRRNSEYNDCNSVKIGVRVDDPWRRFMDAGRGSL